MLTVYKGTFRNGAIVLDEPPALDDGVEVLVSLDPAAPTASEAAERPDKPFMLTPGVFGFVDFTEEDFKAAEWHGDPDDGMDWTGS